LKYFGVTYVVSGCLYCLLFSF